jgi:hypothetical protein
MKKTFITAILSFVFLHAISQINITLIVPPLSSRLSELIRQSSQVTAIYTNTSAKSISYKMNCKLTIDNNIIAEYKLNDSPTEILNPMESKTYKLSDIGDITKTFDYNNPMVAEIIRSGYLPAGNLQLCISLFDANDMNVMVSLEQCKNSIVTSYQPPIAVSPDNNSIINSNSVSIFRWSPVTPAYKGLVNYKVQVFEIMDGQDAMQAFRSNQPIWEKNTNALQQFWPMEVPREAGNYLWTIRAYDNEDQAIGSYETYAEFRTFSIQNSNLNNPATNTTISVMPTNGFVRAKFFQKGSTNLIYDMILPIQNKQQVLDLFELSDQINLLNMTIDEVKEVPGNAKNIGFGILDVFGNITAVVTEERMIFSFSKNSANTQDIGMEAGNNYVWGKEKADLTLDRIKPLIDNCKELKGLSVLN